MKHFWLTYGIGGAVALVLLGIAYLCWFADALLRFLMGSRGN